MSRVVSLDLPGPLRLIVTDEIAGSELSRAIVLVLEPNGENYTPLSVQWFPSVSDGESEMRTFTAMWLADKSQDEIDEWARKMTS